MDMFTTQRNSRAIKILSVNDPAVEKPSEGVSFDSAVHESLERSQATMRELGLRSVNERGKQSCAMTVNPGRCVAANEQSTLNHPKLKLHLGSAVGQALRKKRHRCTRVFADCEKRARWQAPSANPKAYHQAHRDVAGVHQGARTFSLGRMLESRRVQGKQE
jgi:hypothetical protein